MGIDLFLVFGVLHGVRGEFFGDVSGAAVTHEQWRRDPQRLPKSRRKIHFAHRVKTQKFRELTKEMRHRTENCFFATQYVFRRGYFTSQWYHNRVENRNRVKEQSKKMQSLTIMSVQYAAFTAVLTLSLQSFTYNLLWYLFSRLRTKRNLFYLKVQFVSHSKRFPSRL